jgi:hypothetical protein
MTEKLRNIVILNEVKDLSDNEFTDLLGIPRADLSPDSQSPTPIPT